MVWKFDKEDIECLRILSICNQRKQFLLLCLFTGFRDKEWSIHSFSKIRIRVPHWRHDKGKDSSFTHTLETFGGWKCPKVFYLSWWETNSSSRFFHRKSIIQRSWFIDDFRLTLIASKMNMMFDFSTWNQVINMSYKSQHFYIVSNWWNNGRIFQQWYRCVSRRSKGDLSIWTIDVCCSEECFENGKNRSNLHQS